MAKDDKKAAAPQPVSDEDLFECPVNQYLVETLKSALAVLFQEINVLRKELGLPLLTKQEVEAKIITKNNKRR